MMPSKDDLRPGPATRSYDDPPSVFISYAYEDDHHMAQVRALWQFLRANGVNATLDLPATEHRQDWAIWMLRQIRAARFVLIIASPEYRRRGEGECEPAEGRGVQWEAALIREEVYADRPAALKKFLPVILPGRSVADIPSWLGPTTTSHYKVDGFTVAGVGELLRILTGQPADIQPPLGRSPRLRSGVTTAGTNRLVEPNSTAAAARVSRPRHVDHVLLDVTPIRHLFLHFFDPHFLDEVARGRNSDIIAVEAKQATRLAVLAAKTVYVPAASYIESDLCARIIDEYRGIFDTGQIVLIGSEANIVDFATAKLLQYEEGGERFKKYEAVLWSSGTTPPFRPRMGSATRDITSAWLRRLDDLSGILEGLPTGSLADLESRWAKLPAWLGERAFTPEYVVRGLFGQVPARGPALIVARRAGSHVNSAYFGSYTAELSAGLITDLTYLYSSHRGDRRSVDLPYRRLLHELEIRGVLDLVLGVRPDRIAEIRHRPDVVSAIVSSIVAQEQPPEEASLEIPDPRTADSIPRRIAESPPNPTD